MIEIARDFSVALQDMDRRLERRVVKAICRCIQMSKIQQRLACGQILLGFLGEAAVHIGEYSMRSRSSKSVAGPDCGHPCRPDDLATVGGDPHATETLPYRNDNKRGTT